jgi:hypothetical protein
MSDIVALAVGSGLEAVLNVAGSPIAFVAGVIVSIPVELFGPEL